MGANLEIGLSVVPVVLIVVLFAVLRRWMSLKQRQLNAEEFRLWFAKNCLGMRTDSVPPARRADSSTKTEKAPPAA